MLRHKRWSTRARKVSVPPKSAPQAPVCIFAIHGRVSNARISARDSDEAKTRIGSKYEAAEESQEVGESGGNMGLLSAAAEKFHKKEPNSRPGPSWHFRGRRRLLAEMVMSRPLTKPTRLKGARTRTVQSCSLGKDSATVHSNRILLHGVAWARPLKEMKRNLQMQMEKLPLRRRGLVG